MKGTYRITLEIVDNKITRYQYEFYPDFTDQNGKNQKELGERLLAELNIPGYWDKSTISDHRLGVLFKWMGGVHMHLDTYDFNEKLKELNNDAKLAQDFISDAIAKAAIAQIATRI